MERPVIVYAASGYTGRLTCEALTRLGVPFVAAGRNQERLEAVAREMREKGADCEAIACEHTRKDLRHLLRDRRVIINISGPFSRLGPVVVQAAVDEGVHYVDSTGEQDFMFGIRRDFGQAFADRQLLLAPSAAFLWAPGTAAAELCLQTPGVNNIEVTYAPPSLQTVASLQSMFRSVRRGGEILRWGNRVPVNSTQVHRIAVPGRGTVGALCVGAGEATFLYEDARVQNCKTFFASDTLARASKVFSAWNGIANGMLGHFIDGERLDRFTDAAVLRFKHDPPAEDPEANRFVIEVVGTGGGHEVRVQLDGTSPYVFTGFCCAMAAQELLRGQPKRFGYASLAQAFGAEHVLGRFAEVGTTFTFEQHAQQRSQAA